MKAHIPGTSEHKLRKDEQKVRDEQSHKAEQTLAKHKAQQEAKDHKNLQKEQEKLQKQELKAAKAAEKVSHH